MNRKGHEAARSRRQSSPVIAVVLLLTVTAFAGPAAIGNRWALHYQPARLVNGSPVLFQVTAPKPLRTLTGTWLGHEITFNPGTSQKRWSALAGASLETKPGIYPIQLRALTSTGEALAYERGIRVFHQRYPKVMLKVPARYTAPNPEEQRQIEQDKEAKAQVFRTISLEREWKGRFMAPVNAPISDVFGVQRVFNGAVQSTHQGLDFRVPSGAPVQAVNSGTVLLARPLFFEGTCIVLDHGQGLLTLYMHLSKVDVKEGQQVKGGERIGLSGGSGRATGPHLHLAVRWQGIYLNPALLLALRQP